MFLSSHAGFYATCDAVDFLFSIKHKIPELELTRIFDEHLLIPFQSTESKNLSKEISLIRCQTQTLKLARLVRLSRHKHIFKKYSNYFYSIVDKILSNCIDGIGWGYVIDAKEINIPPTLCMFTSLNDFIEASCSNNTVSELINSGKEYSLEILLNEHQGILNRVLALYTLSEIYNEKDLVKNRDKLRQLISPLYVSLIDNSDSIEGVRFANPHTRVDDFYNFHLSFTFILAVLNLYDKKSLSPEYISSYSEVLGNAADQLIKEGYFSSYHKKSKEEIYFWDLHQCLYSLYKMKECYFKSNNRHAFMIIKPRHFKDSPVNLDNKLCAVMMPFKEEWSDDVFETYKTTLEKNEFIVWRSDLEFSDDEIMQTVWEKLVNCKFVIADCTDRNPNVFYEIGLAHALGKPVLITTQNEQDIPFDLGRIRYFDYNTRTSGQRDLSETITQFIRSL